MDEEVLTGYDYMTRPYMELQSHPNFSETAYRAVAEVQGMNTRELELLHFSMFP